MNDTAASDIYLLWRVGEAISRSKCLVSITETEIAKTQELLKRSRELTEEARAILAEAHRRRLHVAASKSQRSVPDEGDSHGPLEEKRIWPSLKLPEVSTKGS
jgi:hypothetical protein